MIKFVKQKTKEMNKIKLKRKRKNYQELSFVILCNSKFEYSKRQYENAKKQFHS